MKLKYAINPFDLMVYENAQLMEENAKLRELCKLYAKAIEEDGCHWCLHYEDVACDPETVPMRGGCGCMLWEELRELGVTDD